MTVRSLPWRHKALVLASLILATAFIRLDQAASPVTAIKFGPEVPDVRVIEVATPMPQLNEFTAELWTGDPHQVVGVYAQPFFALRVVPQVTGDPSYVSMQSGQATLFGPASQFGTTGLLAHYELSGSLFFRLSIGQTVEVVYGNGEYRAHTITGTRRFRALSPTDPYSYFLNLDSPASSPISSTELFYEIYAPGDRLVLQTCLPAEGNPSWGRLFVIAIPIR